MAAIILPRRHYTQPAGRSSIDWGNPLTRDLAMADTPTSPGELVKIGNMPTVGGVLGAAHSFGNTSYLRQSNTAITSMPLTFVYFGDGIGVANTASFMSVGAGTHRALLYVAANNNSLLFFTALGGSTNQDALVRGTINSGIFFTAAVFSGINNRELYWQTEGLVPRYGFFSGSSPTGAYNTLAVGQYWNNDAPTAGFYNPGTCFLSAAWKRALTSEEITEVRLNPWQLFKADPVRIYSLPPVLTIPALSNPGVIDITTTSARPRVTLAY